ncbi:MAG: hypothetical protein WA418_03330, partial [Bradyrhizobium sp.]
AGPSAFAGVVRRVSWVRQSNALTVPGSEVAAGDIRRRLTQSLPPSGGELAEAEITLWLQLLEGSFKLIYKDGSARIPTSPG